MTDTDHDAPAEGAGERDYPAEFEAWWQRHRNANREKADYNVKKQIAFDAFYHGARSSAPEAREEALGNLLAVVHGDGGHRALEVGTKQAALEAEKIVANLLSSAPEAGEGELAGYANAEFMRRLKNWREVVPNAIRSDETFLKAVASESYPVPLYTHPAALSADKLRIAVAALEGARDPLSTGKMWGKRKGGCDGAVDKIDRALWGIKQALAVLRAGGKS